MNFKERLKRDQRLAVLQVLEQDAGYSHNEQILQMALDATGHKVSSDRVRTLLAWLEEQDLVEIDREGVRDLWVVKLTGRGIDVAQGRALCEGVKRPRPV